MAQRVLIASANPWSFCMAVERDMARAHANAEVDALNLFPLCSGGSPHWRPRDRLIETIDRKFARFVASIVNGRDITADIRVPQCDIPPLPADYEELRAYQRDGARIGLAVLSSVTSLTTIQYASSLAEYGPVLEQAWRSAHLSHRAGLAVRALGYDKIVIFNGRHCYSRPFCDLLKRDSQVIRYEQGSAGNRYIWKSGSVHHPDALKGIIEAQPLDRDAGEAFFRARLQKDPTSEVSLMTATQRQGALPPDMAPGRTVAFFTSSSDEMFAVGDEVLHGTFPTQNAIALALADICNAQGLQLVLRLHPHLRFKHPAWEREWDFSELERRNVLVLAPDDPVDSYAVLKAARAAITTGSTIGFEAAYLGVPSAVVGTGVSRSLGAAAAADTRAELAQFIAEPHLLPGARDAALRFGSFHRTGGKLLPELDVGIHPNLARIGGRVVDPIRYAAQKLRFLLRPPPTDPSALDLRSGMQAGRVLLPPGRNYSSVYGRAATSGETNTRRASTENSLSGE